MRVPPALGVEPVVAEPERQDPPGAERADLQQQGARLADSTRAHRGQSRVLAGRRVVGGGASGDNDDDDGPADGVARHGARQQSAADAHQRQRLVAPVRAGQGDRPIAGAGFAERHVQHPPSIVRLVSDRRQSPNGAAGHRSI